MQPYPGRVRLPLNCCRTGAVQRNDAMCQQRTKGEKQQLHQLGAGGTGVFKKAGNASQRAAKRDS